MNLIVELNHEGTSEQSKTRLTLFVMKYMRLKAATLLKLTLYHGCFPCFLNCTNGTNSCKALYIMQLKSCNK